MWITQLWVLPLPLQPEDQTTDIWLNTVKWTTSRQIIWFNRISPQNYLPFCKDLLLYWDWYFKSINYCKYIYRVHLLFTKNTLLLIKEMKDNKNKNLFVWKWHAYYSNNNCMTIIKLKHASECLRSLKINLYPVESCHVPHSWKHLHSLMNNAFDTSRAL